LIASLSFIHVESDMHVVRHFFQGLNSISLVLICRGKSQCVPQQIFVYIPFLNVVAFSGRVYGDTRMDTNWAFRQAYAQLISIISQSSTIFLQIRQGAPD
jgi:hypothetical protein